MNEKNSSKIKEMFDSIATGYDRTNAILSFNFHNYWKKALVNSIESNKNEKILLDLCAGTGDIAEAFVTSSSQKQHMILLDFSPKMLDIAKKKLAPFHTEHIVEYIEGDAMKIPLEGNYISRATMAYGIRNIKDPQKAINEVFRVLKPGGVFGILELTRPSNPLIRFGHKIYLKTLLPLLGKWMTNNQDAYEYLNRSINNFIPAEKLESSMLQAGFQNTKIKRLTFGIATIVIGKK